MSKETATPEQVAKCIDATIDHAWAVRRLTDGFIKRLSRQAGTHDESKLDDPEVEIFALYTAKLATSTYGSDEYKRFLAEMKPALDHHYAANRHHPEHFSEGIRGMNLVDLVEMICDWVAASGRHANGDVRRSIEINQSRFGYSDDLKQILLNTVAIFEKEVPHA